MNGMTQKEKIALFIYSFIGLITVLIASDVIYRMFE